MVSLGLLIILENEKEFPMEDTLRLLVSRFPNLRTCIINNGVTISATDSRFFYFRAYPEQLVYIQLHRNFRWEIALKQGIRSLSPKHRLNQYLIVEGEGLPTLLDELSDES